MIVNRKRLQQAAGSLLQTLNQRNINYFTDLEGQVHAKIPDSEGLVSFSVEDGLTYSASYLDRENTPLIQIGVNLINRQAGFIFRCKHQFLGFEVIGKDVSGNTLFGKKYQSSADFSSIKKDLELLAKDD